MGQLADALTLVGGCAAGFLITDDAAPAVRPTVDVDVVVEAASYVEYHSFGAQLRKRGFQPGGVPGDPICRWRMGDLILDVMPLDEKTLGFTNRCYPSAIRNRVSARLRGGVVVHHLDGPHFLATKLAAFESRGGEDVLASRDIEDIVRVVDGRPSVVGELHSAPQDLRRFVGGALSRVSADPYFAEAMPSYFGAGSPAVARARLVGQRLKSMAEA